MERRILDSFDWTFISCRRPGSWDTSSNGLPLAFRDGSAMEEQNFRGKKSFWRFQKNLLSDQRIGSRNADFPFMEVDPAIIQIWFIVRVDDFIISSPHHHHCRPPHIPSSTCLSGSASSNQANAYSSYKQIFWRMGQFFDSIPPSLIPWIQKQQIFWVATAPLSKDGHVNLSPKCTRGMFYVFDEKTVWYEDMTGSGVETISHIRENGRVTILFTAFEGPPRIVRLFGTGIIHEFGSTEYNTLIPPETRQPGSRAVIMVDVHKVGTACGYSIPFFDFKSHRNQLHQWAVKKEVFDTSFDPLAPSESDNPSLTRNGAVQLTKLSHSTDFHASPSAGLLSEKGIRSYWLAHNAHSIDGIPGLATAPMCELAKSKEVWGFTSRRTYTSDQFASESMDSPVGNGSGTGTGGIIREKDRIHKSKTKGSLGDSSFWMGVGVGVGVMGVWMSVLGQDFSPPSIWQEPDLNTTLADRAKTAGDGLNEALLSFDESKAVFPVTPDIPVLPAYLFYELAKFDLLTNDTQYKSKLQGYYNVVKNVHVNFGGYTLLMNLSVQAYYAYRDDSFLQFAEDAWNYGLGFTITQDEVDAGKLNVKDITLPDGGQCNSSSIVGGTFFNSDVNDPYLAGLGTGAFFVLSSLLAEATSDPKYRTAATQSAQFIHTFLLDPNSNMIFDGFNADSCSSFNQDLFSYNTGLAIEGLAMLVSQTGDSTMGQWLKDILSASILKANWLSSHGIVQTPDDVQPQYLMLGMSAAYNYTTDSTIKDFVGKFITVQYNAIIHHATSDGSNLYGKDWTGPPLVQTSPRSQTAALSVLVNALALPDVASDSSDGGNGSGSSDGGGDGSTNATTSGTASKSNTAAIIGGAVGGAAFALLVLLGVWVLFRRRRARQTLKDHQRASIPYPVVTPYRDDGDFPMTERTRSENTGSNSAAYLTTVPLRTHIREGGSGNGYRGGKLGVANHTEAHHDEVASDTPPSLPPQNGNNMSTEELVRLLNQRLQGGESRSSGSEPDAPPAYHKI
ncbi:hypothetical protein D9758_009841 [Tetrapyrgos nigripes]|uniref:Pyridoxamine 5'-phosphate oxidase N-terminal domain-containing protein n=1 Tax=Tetrapyrgos nigripes TaxID=182062 RepID=A0A8H5LSE5_9AGAR|nr:hypothetical protein D9758_009841 [Tetrapyrgos nigripes]